MDNEPALRVLLVDDAGDVLNIFKWLISQVFPHWEVVGVTSAESAFDQLPRFHPNIVMTNIMMPGMDGIEMVCRMKQSPTSSYLYVIMCTARGDVDAKLRATSAGAADYLVKPVHPNDVITAFEVARFHILGDYPHGS